MKNMKLFGLVGCIISIGLLMFNVGWSIYLIVECSSKPCWLPIIGDNPVMWGTIIMLVGCVGAIFAAIAGSRKWLILAAAHFILYALELCAS